jgi:hypothetical protein
MPLLTLLTNLLSLQEHFEKDVNEGEGATYKDSMLVSNRMSYYQSTRETKKEEDRFMATIAVEVTTLLIL